VMLLNTTHTQRLSLMILVGVIVYGVLTMATNRNGCRMVTGLLRR